MKIAIVETGLPPHQIGGAELQAWNLATELKRRGHEVSVFTRQLPGTSGYEFKDDIRIFRVDTYRRPFGIASYLLGILSLIKKQERAIDIVLCFRAWPNGVIGLMAQRLLKIPACFSIRGGDWYQVEPRWWGKIIYKALFASGIPVLVQSQKMAHEIRESYPAVVPKIIPNGIRLNALEHCNGDSVIYVGNLHPHKGVKLLLEAVRQIPECSVKILGDGPGRESLEKSAAGLNVQFYGRVSPEMVREVTLNYGKILVLPTLYSEGFPNSLLEAMSLGIPVIASDVPGGVRELLENGKAGILVTPGDVGALQRAIETLMTDQSLQNEMSRTGRQAAEKYSWPNIAARWEELFQQMLER